MQTLLQDLRYGLRMAVKNPGFSLVVVLILALGIGISSTLFSIIDGALLHPFAYKDGERAVVLHQKFPRKNLTTFFFSVPEYLDLRSLNHVFEDVAAMRHLSLNITEGDNPERIFGVRVTANAFTMTGVGPYLGRTFRPDEDRPGGPNVVVLSHHFWKSRFLSDPQIVGKTIKLNDESYTVIGVMPSRYRWWGADVWLPMGLNTADTDRTRRSLWIAGWLRPGMTIDQAALEFQGLANRIEQEQGSAVPEYVGWQIMTQSILEAIIRDLKPTLLILLGAVALIVVISCANAANLLLARASARKKEIAVRIALGAGRLRIIRQLLTESLVLSMISGAFGFLLNYLALDTLVALIPASYISSEAEIVANYSAFIFTLGVSMLVGVVFGVIPAWQSSNANLSEVLKEGGRRSSGDIRGRRARSLLVVAEIALALVVLIGAGLMIRSYMQLTEIKPGFNADNVLTMRISLPESRYADGQQVASFYEELLRRVNAIPGVESSAAVSGRPMSEIAAQDFSIEGRPADAAGGLANADYRVITPDYFDMMQIPIRRGRYFTRQDVPESQLVAIINQTMANQYWPDEDPIGKRIRLGNQYTATSSLRESSAESSWLTIVGVVADAKQRPDMLRQIRPEFYLPHLQRANISRDMALLVRGSVEPASLTTAVRDQVRSLDPQQPAYEVWTLEEIVARALGPKRLSIFLLSIFGIIALLLATIGLYATIAYSVSQRTHEIGIRMALGAQKGDVLRLILSQGLRLTLIGLGVGLVLAITLTRLMSSLLYGVSATDPVTIICISLILTVVALLASYIPALRATKVDPGVVLRFE